MEQHTAYQEQIYKKYMAYGREYVFLRYRILSRFRSGGENIFFIRHSVTESRPPENRLHLHTEYRLQPGKFR